MSDLLELLAKANEEKSGDQLTGLAAGSERERVASKHALADLPLTNIMARPLIEDESPAGRAVSSALRQL
jgi:ethanolamine ammonia-lyase large subunit